MNINDVITLLGAIAAILGAVGIILNTVRQSVHNTKLDAIAADVTAAATSVNTVASDVKVVAALLPPVPVPATLPIVAGVQDDMLARIADQEKRMGVMTAALVALCDGKINGADGVAGKAVQLQGGQPLPFQPIPDFR